MLIFGDHLNVFIINHIFLSKLTSPELMPCHRISATVSAEWSTIVYQSLPCMDYYPLAAERGAPKKRYKDCLEKSLTTCHVDPLSRIDMEVDRDAWHHSIFKMVNEFEENRANVLRQEKQKRSSKCCSHYI